MEGLLAPSNRTIMQMDIHSELIFLHKQRELSVWLGKLRATDGPANVAGIPR